MTRLPILVVDDDVATRESTVTSLHAAGYATTESGSTEQALDEWDVDAPALVIVNAAAADDGAGSIEVCRRLRRLSDVPVIVVIDHSEELDEVLALAVGADAVISRPVSPRRLTAHVDAVLRRCAHASDHQGEDADATLDREGVHIDLDARTVTVNDEVIDLTRIQYDLLAALAEHPARVLTRQQLVERVWGTWYGSDHHLDVHLSRLRGKVTAAGGPRVAHAVRGVGFRFAEGSGRRESRTA